MNTREILIKQGMLDDDIIMLIKDAIHENYLTVEFRELTDNQAEIISNFKWWRIDLSRLDKLSDTQLNILSKFWGWKIEISWLDKISESTINILNSFNSDRSEDFIIIINFTIDDNNKDKIFGFIKDFPPSAN